MRVMDAGTMMMHQGNVGNGMHIAMNAKHEGSAEGRAYIKHDSQRERTCMGRSRDLMNG